MQCYIEINFTQSIKVGCFPKLILGMTIGEFDNLFPDCRKSTKYQNVKCRTLEMPWGDLHSNFLMTHFDEEDKLNYIYLDLKSNKKEDFVFSVDENNLNGCKKLLNFLSMKEQLILEDNDSATLYFPNLGINLTGIHKSSAHQYLEIIPAGYYECLEDDAHPYRGKQILQKLSKNFTVIPNAGVMNDKLNEIKLNTAKSILINCFTPYCQVNKLSSDSWNIQDVIGIEFDIENGLSTTISLDIKRLNVFYADVKIGKDKKWLDKLKNAKDEIIELPNINIILVPQDHIAILPYPELIYIMNLTEYESYAKNVINLERQSTNIKHSNI